MTQRNPELRKRIERFSLLRAAQRALARCMHPAVLDPLREHGRQLLIHLQEAAPEASEIHDEVAFRDIDRQLGHHLGQTQELLGRLEFSQLRAAGPELCREKPEELRALVDVILLGSLADDQEIRLAEYLITMLCIEDRDGRRTQVRDPRDQAKTLREIELPLIAESDVCAAVAQLQEAADSLIRGGDHGDVRDEIRGFKQELGAGILHPEILAATVAYNVAMSNQVSARIDSTLALDQLADDLLADLDHPDAGGGDLLHGREMESLVAALRARILGVQGAGDPASRIAKAFRLDGLVAREVEALEDPEGDDLNPLIASAVVLGCSLRQGAALTELLAEIGLDPDELENLALPALLREMGAASSKFFADGGYAQAFLISEVKTRNLTAVHAAAKRRARGDEAGPSGASRPSRRRWLPFGISPALLSVVAGPLLGLVIGAMIFSPLDDDVRIFSSSELLEISPFLDSGHERMEQGSVRFVGHLFPTWGYLPTPARESAASEVAEYFVTRGVREGVLLSAGPRVMVRWADGEITELTVKPQD